MLTIALLILAALLLVGLIGLVLYQFADCSFFEWLFIFQPALNGLFSLLGAVLEALVKAIDNR